MRKLLYAVSAVLLPVCSFAAISVSVDGGITGISSNSVIDIDHDPTSVWLGTGSGAAVTIDTGGTWNTYGAGPLPSDEVSALAANDRGVWVASSHSQVSQGQSYPFGDGISLTTDRGQTWSVFRPEQSTYYGKLSYDLALFDSIAYSACFYGGLIRTLDKGRTWQNLYATQLSATNSDSVDYVTNAFQNLSNRYFSVKADTFGLPDTLSVWAGSAAGVYRFYFLSYFSENFSSNLSRWTLFGDPTPAWLDSVFGRYGVFKNNGDTLCNSGAASKILVGTPAGFTMETDIYLQLVDSAGCWAEAGIGLPRDASPGWSADCSDSTYGLSFSLEYFGDSCAVADSAFMRHAWFKASIYADDGTYEEFIPDSSSNADQYIDGWHTLKVSIGADRTVSFLVDTTLAWTPTKRLNPMLMTGRNVVLGYRSSGWAGRAYHDWVRVFENQTPRVYHTYPDSIAHYVFNLADTSIADSLKLPGNHVVAIGINGAPSAKTVWAACRPVSSGESRRIAYTSDDGATWHVAPVASAAGDANVEGWDFAFNIDTVYAATSFGLYRSDGNYSNWSLLSGFVDRSGEAFYQDNAPFYAVDFFNGIVWAGGSDGVVRSKPDSTWKVYRSMRDPDQHYAYPSPFSPTLSTRKGTTIHFKPLVDTKATVRIYDFNLELVKTVVTDRPRVAGVESDDIVWDGRNGDGTVVANGVYFYRIELNPGGDIWGKVVVIK